MAETRESLLDIVNTSGFPFQLRVEHEVDLAQTQWVVIAREHRWFDPTTNKEGFIDIILSNGASDNVRVVIECKRVLDTSWIFLVPSDASRSTSKAYACWIDRVSGQRDLLGWHDFWCYPETQEAEFCVVRGQGPKDKPMLERMCGELLQSVESLALEELGLAVSSEKVRRTYIPVVITTASLHICKFDINGIDIAKGQIPQADTEEVDFIRFRKGLTSRVTPAITPLTLEEAHHLQERTVFVVNSAKLGLFLSKLNLQWYAERSWPGSNIREKIS